MKTKRLIQRPNGFTLLEALFAAMLIGLVIAALAVSSGAFTMANAAAVDMSTAEFLIEEIRERSAHLPFADLTALGGTYSPPIDVAGLSLGADFGVFEQQVTVAACGTDFNAAAGDFVRITVAIRKSNRPISEASWIRANLD